MWPSWFKRICRNGISVIAGVQLCFQVRIEFQTPMEGTNKRTCTFYKTFSHCLLTGGADVQYYTLLWKPRISFYPFLINCFPPSGFHQVIQMASVPTKLLIKHFWERELKSCLKFCCLLFLRVVAQWSARISRTANSCLETSKPQVTIWTTSFNTKIFYVLLTQCTYVICMDLRTNSDYFPIQH